jgi:hypothetical protein
MPRLVVFRAAYQKALAAALFGRGIKSLVKSPPFSGGNVNFVNGLT